MIYFNHLLLSTSANFCGYIHILLYKKIFINKLYIVPDGWVEGAVEDGHSGVRRTLKNI